MKVSKTKREPENLFPQFIGLNLELEPGFIEC